MNSFLLSLYGKFRSTVLQISLETKGLVMGIIKSIKLWWMITIVSRVTTLLTKMSSIRVLVGQSLTQCWHTIRSTYTRLVKKLK